MVRMMPRMGECKITIPLIVDESDVLPLRAITGTATEKVVSFKGST